MVTLFDANPGCFKIFRINGHQLTRHLENLGIRPKTVVTKMKNVKETTPAIRVATKEREGVLGIGICLKIWVDYHGSTTTLESMPPNVTSVVKELSGGESMVEAVGLLGIREGEEVTVLHRLPPMDYVVTVNGPWMRVGEGLAAKVWGTREGRPIQLTALGAGNSLVVDKVAGGKSAVKYLEGLGIRFGAKIIVNRVEPRQAIGIGRTRVVCIRSPEGIELWLGKKEAAAIMGKVEAEN